MKTFNTVQEYATAKMMLSEYNAAAFLYCAQNKTNGIPVEVTATFPYADKVTNELRSAVEVYEFMQDKPNYYFLYINETTGKAQTWTGQELGNVSFGHEWRSNFGDRRQAITVHGINKVTYYGTYYKSSGDYARIKMKKYS
jgi:hypothetical protein